MSKSTYPTSSNRSEYDIFVAAHATDNAPFAHFGPTVLPWHRIYLDRLDAFQIIIIILYE